MNDQSVLERTLVTVNLDKATTKIELKPGQTILNAVLEKNLDPPFACEAGECGTCRARLISGKIHMIRNEALHEEDLQDGLILTCQAQALTPDVCVDYDNV